MTKDFTAKEWATVHIALQAWAIRCDTKAAEAELMAEACWTQLSVDQETLAKCLANAAASREFATEARAVLYRLNNRT